MEKMPEKCKPLPAHSSYEKCQLDGGQQGGVCRIRGADNFRYSGTGEATSTPILLCINYEITQKINKSEPPSGRSLSRPRSARDQQAVMTFSETLIKNPKRQKRKIFYSHLKTWSN